MRRIAALAAVLALFATACDTILITNPGPGVITDAPAVPVDGTIPDNLPLGGELTVNGVSTPVNADRTWSTSVPAVSDAYVTPIEAVYVTPGGQEHRHRTAVVNGVGLADGEYSSDGVGMLFTDAGLQGLGPVINDLAGGAFDIGALLLSQNPIIDEENAFLHFDITGDAYEAGIGGVEIDVDSTSTGVATDIDISDLYVGVNLTIRDGLLINAKCGLEIQIPTTAINAKFDLVPDAADPAKVDVNLVGTPTVDTGAVDYEFTSGICDGDVFAIGDIVNAVAGPQVQALAADGFVTALADPDGAGPADSPIADAIETALADISIAGSVGTAIKANLDGPFTAINETDQAIDFRADADFYSTIGAGPTDCQPAAGAPDLPATYDVPGSYPTPGATTPSGDPYGLGLVISASAFNQMLGAMTECGLLNQELHEISLGGPPLPVTSTLLSALVPAFAGLPANSPMYIKVSPNYGPFLSDKAGPNGEPGELNLADLQLEFVLEGAGSAPDTTQLTLAVDAPLGFDLGYDPVAGVLAPTITPPAAASVDVRVVQNAIGADETGLEALFPNLFPMFVGGLSSSFGAFPLPAFLGLQLEVLDVERTDNYFTLYANLNPVPQTRIENVSITDLSSGDSVVDSVFDVNEWRHRLRKKVAPDQVRVDLKGMLGADACCFTGDESRSAHAGYRIAMDVVPENGETWKLDLSQMLAGAHSIYDEDLGRGSSQFTSAITGRVRVGDGPWQSFNTNPSVASASTGNGDGSDAYRPFTGSAATSVQGNTAQTVTVEFGFDMHVSSDSDVFPPRAGDEVAIRFGANDTIANGFTAGEYPGMGSRNLVTDGHVGVVTLSTVP